MLYQLVPLDNHRRNITERAIQTWKNHFVGVISGTATTFPLRLWCHAITQAKRQLMLKYPPTPPVYGQHDYNAEPFVPMRMDSQVQDKPNQRKTFAAHCRKGYVLGTYFEHYWAWQIWMINTRATRVSATVFHKHKYLSNPTATPADAIIAAAGNLITSMKGHLPHRLQESYHSELMRLSTIFSDASAPPQIEIPPQRHSPKLTTKNTKDNDILTQTCPPLSPPMPMEPLEDSFEHAIPNLDFPETPPRVAPHTNPPRVTPPAPPVPPTPRVDTHNGPPQKLEARTQNSTQSHI